MLKVKILESEKEKNELYSIRYKTFVEKEKTIPAENYENGLLKDAYDEYAYHLGCYEGDILVGFFSLVVKRGNELLEVEKTHNLMPKKGEKYAEVLRLVVLDTPYTKTVSLKGKVLELLFNKVKDVIITEKITHLLLQSRSTAKKMYERIGFSQVGDYKLYRGKSYQCPMKLDVMKVNQRVVDIQI
ncbi:MULTISPECIES: GNAT family N-acetyltransferase [Bacillus cereus group]|uniref:GNAT family N-acetyltransferase n=1 Tax=Bacillus cereus TaxID=1396 RepID=A0AAE9TE06_BACCE|nr:MULTISPECIES: GNAT family N-acetyltransferase [Bacillus cereus group]RXJ13135.1 GNAT family N-acetyltransferase [Bacillus albus]RXJ23398.1 GNAT family N-acetyltransferase [Bacillus albus]RXJ24837.1 GNAT family N-acetyltransferase [Bacillus albus]RXJ36135.1 GNAT family N-acetyltransferase [Bacillus albus]RXJ54218.1 GNAT family N-acetyltransferase [Bacillus albus]